MKIFPDKKIKDHFDAFAFLRLDMFFLNFECELKKKIFYFNAISASDFIEKTLP